MNIHQLIVLRNVNSEVARYYYDVAQILAGLFLFIHACLPQDVAACGSPMEYGRQCFLTACLESK